MLTPVLAALALLLPQTESSAMRADALGRPVIAVQVNGGAPVDFVVDTAASQHVVMPRLVQRMALRPAADRADLQGASGLQTAALYDLVSLTSEAFDHADVQAVGLPNGNATDAWGIVGMEDFDGHKVSFDRERMRFAIQASGPARAGMASVPAVLLGTFAVVEVHIEGVSMLAVIDSGAARTVANAEAMAALGWAKDDPRLTAARPVAGATTQELGAWSGKVGGLRLGPAAFDDVTLTFSDLPVFAALGLGELPALILGSDLLNRLPAYAIDYPRSELHLKAPPLR